MGTKGIPNAFDAAEVAPAVFVGSKAEYPLSRGQPQVGTDDRERAFFGEQREKPGRNDVDSGKSQRPADFASAPAEPEVLVEEKSPGGGPVFDGQCGQRVVGSMELDHAAKVDRADHIDVVQNKWFGIALEEP